jgi:PAS domain S-box-containing protein
MNSLNNIFGSSKEAKDTFVPYYEKENDFRRLIVIHSIASFIICPLFSYFIYDTDIPQIYVYLSLSYTVLNPIYILLCFFIKPLYTKLIYFFIFHLFGITYFAYIDLLDSQFELLNFFCFYSLYAVVLYVMQRLYPAILYNVFVLSLLIYGFQSTESVMISKIAAFGLFSILTFCSVIVLLSRQKMINSVEDYSNYLKKIVNNPGIGFVLFKISDTGESIIDNNSEASRLLDSKDGKIEKVFDLLTEEERNRIIHLKIGNEVKKTVTLNLNTSKRSLEFDISILPLKNGMYWLLRIVDITDKMLEKEELANREKKYRNLYYRNQSGVFTTDLTSTILDCNQAFEEMFEGSISKGSKLFKDSQIKEWQEILELIEGRENLRNYQTHFTLANGTTKWFIFNWYIDKLTNHIEGTIMDLTEVQKASAALSQSEEKYRLIYEESNDAILLLDEDKIIDVNRKGIQLFGIPQRQLLATELYDLSFELFEESKKEYKRHKQKLHLSKSTKFNWVFKGNNQRIEAEVAIIELMLGDKTYYQCVIHDLTQRNETMRSLDKNRQSFKSVLDNTPEGIIIVFEDTILYTNPEAQRLKSAESIELNELFIKKDQRIFSELMLEQKQVKGIQQRQLKLKNVSNEELLVDVTLVSTTFEGKDAILIILKDISIQNQLSKEMLRAEIAEETNKKLADEIKERIRTEKLLQEQFLRSNAIFDSSSNTLLLTLDTSFKISSLNTHCQNYFWYLTEKKIELNDSFISFFSNLFPEVQLRYFQRILNHVKKGVSKQMESHFFSKGSERWIELFINPIFDIEGRVTEISLVAHDITEKKKSEKEIVESLKEKEVLLKEIHHRVKNNLQVISSILNLQSSFVKDQKTLEILDESRNRIRSMAIIHENLYRTTNFSSIDFSSYLLNLTTNLISSYHVQSGIIRLQTEMDPIDLVLDQAIPCGLLVNELITNTIKYAFPDKKDGEILIGLKEENNRILLKIEDNGIGLPEGFDISKSDTLGLQLVATLVEQLDGEITVNNFHGTKYLITFEKAKL